jgi:membrane protein YdbS with pleckstrin-like domain
VASSLFHPPAAEWRRLAPAYATVRTISALLTNVIFWGVVTAAAWLMLDWRYGVAALAVGLAWTLWRVIRAGRYARSWGYAERGEDLCITKGLWFKELTVVPYGRLQLAKVESGPIAQMFKLATVTLVTASAQSNASIPGLPVDEATALRDRLIDLGDSRGAGL